MLEQRDLLISRAPIDISSIPEFVTWVRLDGSNRDAERRLRAGHIRLPAQSGPVLVIGDSRNRQGRHDYAKRVRGAATVEAVDLSDLVRFAERLDLAKPDALEVVVDFGASMMTAVGPQALLSRVRSLLKGTARNEATDVEACAMTFARAPSYGRVAELLEALNRQPGVHVYRPEILQACFRALQACQDGGTTFRDAAVAAREHNRAIGRHLPARAVGSTLLLKGLEGDVSVILDAESLCPRNLYVAMTRGARKLVICSHRSILHPYQNA